MVVVVVSSQFGKISTPAATLGVAVWGGCAPSALLRVRSNRISCGATCAGAVDEARGKMGLYCTQNSTSRSTRERDGCILLAIKMKAMTTEGRWRNIVWPSSCVTPAGASTSLTSIINGMTTHTHYSYEV